MFIVALVGVPGVGKSTITKLLALDYQTSFAPEYGQWYCQNIKKSYLDQNGKPSTNLADFVKIVDGQIEWNKLAIANSQTLKKNICFFDTDMIFHQFFFCKQFPESTLLIDQLPNPEIDFYIFLESEKILLKPDSPLTQENFFKEQEYLKKLYLQFLDPQKIVFITDGEPVQRIKLIKKLINQKLNETTEK